METRRSIRDPQIRDAADQYRKGFYLLLSQGAFSGVSLPMLSCGAIAVELYLKSLNAHIVYERILPGPGFWVHAEARSAGGKSGHELTALLDSMPSHVRDAVVDGFAEHDSMTFRDYLSALDGLFASARYPYESKSRIGEYRTDYLETVLDFLASFSAGLPEEWIE